MLQIEFHFLGHMLKAKVNVGFKVFLFPTINRIGYKRPLDSRHLIVTVHWHYFHRGHVRSKPHVVLEDLIAQTPSDGIDLDQPLFSPPGLIFLGFGGGAVSDQTRLTIDSLDTVTRVDCWEPLVDVTEVWKNRPDFLSCDTVDLGYVLAFPLKRRCFRSHLTHNFALVLCLSNLLGRKIKNLFICSRQASVCIWDYYDSTLAHLASWHLLTCKFNWSISH